MSPRSSTAGLCGYTAEIAPTTCGCGVPAYAATAGESIPPLSNTAVLSRSVLRTARHISSSNRSVISPGVRRAVSSSASGRQYRPTLEPVSDHSR